MRVTIARAQSYKYEEVKQATDECLQELGGWRQFIRPGDRVLIKPNLVEGMAPEKAVNTHPEVVRAIIRGVQAAGAIPLVGDSPGVSSTFKAAEKSGIAEVCRDEGAELVPFDHSVEVHLSSGHTVKKFAIATALQQVDKVISAAKMKTHTFMGTTGGVKNLFGCIVGTNKAQFHLRMQRRQHFASMLVDLNSLIKPVLYIVDGVIGMEGNGPRNGQPKPAGVIIAGPNGYAVDLIMAEKMGFNGEKLPVHMAALAEQLAPTRTEIVVSGSGKDMQFYFKEPFNLESLDGRIPTWLANFGQQRLTARPAIADKCIGCQRCAQHCPPQAITMVDRKAHIDYNKCIRCYCCQELCPHDAVKLREGLLLKAVKGVGRVWRR